jgi:hypothetical protein
MMPTTLFAPVDTTDPTKKRAMVHSLDLRALSLEFCRQRMVADFFTRLFGLAKSRSIPMGPDEYPKFLNFFLRG